MLTCAAVAGPRTGTHHRSLCHNGAPDAGIKRLDIQVRICENTLVIFGKEGIMKVLLHVVLGIIIILGFSASVFAGDETDEKQVDTETTPESKPVPAAETAPKEKGVTNPEVILETNYGNITLELFMKEAPISVDNFLSYVREGFYDGTVFHRVIKGFVLQAGGMNKDMAQKAQKDPIKNEATNGLKNKKYTLSMARTSAINSGTSHFFINLRDNTSLDHYPDDPTKFGYAVFGKVVDGMDVVDKIALVDVTTRGRHENVPVKPVTIKKATIVGESEEAETGEAEKAADEEPADKAEPEATKQEIKKEAEKIQDE
jgi:cyclophilin family peptidyl-prolyl cis-trans isomerase